MNLLIFLPGCIRFFICSASFISNFSWPFISLWLSRVTIRVRTMHYALYYHNKTGPSKNMTQFWFQCSNSVYEKGVCEGTGWMDPANYVPANSNFYQKFESKIFCSGIYTCNNLQLPKSRVDFPRWKKISLILFAFYPAAEKSLY